MKAANKFKPLVYAGCVSLAAFASGCVSKDMTDLEAFVAEKLAREGGKIEPLPAIKPYERYLYTAADAGLRDPFISFSDEEDEIKQVEKVMDAQQQEYANEILTHNREELEGHELDALRMVGVLENAEILWGIVTDPTGVVHRVQVGNYVGRNFGKIINIQEDRIDVREIIKDSQGHYEEREAALALSEQ
ncbi:MAG: pilus assembly protein PilP [Gammaproteobacteria bacterium]